MSPTRALLLLIGSLLFAAPAVAPAKPSPVEAVENVLTMSVDGTLIIEKDGSPGPYQLTTPLTEELIAMLDKAIVKWRFHPVVVDGVAVRAQSRMRISLAATQLGKDYEVRIENVVFPGPGKDKQEGQAVDFSSSGVRVTPGDMHPPIYPGALERAAVSGRVLLGLRFGLDGHVQDVVAVQSMLYNVKGRDRSLSVAIRMFEDSALRAARGWTANVQVKPGASAGARDFTAFVPVEYLMLGERASENVPSEAPPGQWRLVSRTGKRGMPWLAGEKDVPEVGVADLHDGELLPMAGAPKFVSTVANTLL